MARDINSLAQSVFTALDSRTVSVAESLTGGLVSAALTQIPGASTVFHGGIVAYHSSSKIELLGVDEALLSHGAVQSDVALQMALGVARRLGTQFGVATTGVAGPSSQDGQAPGTVFIGVVEIDQAGEIVSASVENLHIESSEIDPIASRESIREQTVCAALELLLTYL